MARAVEAWAAKQANEKEDDLAHVRQYAEQVGMSYEDALEKFGYANPDEEEGPDIPEGYEFVWHWFFELAQGRSQSGFGVNPISWQEMAAWAQITGVTLNPWLALCFRAMDQAWLKAIAKQGNGNGGKSGADNID